MNGRGRGKNGRGIMNGSGRHGGRRCGAGRPCGTGRFGEQTKPVRIPVSKIDAVKEFLQIGGGDDSPTIPLYGCGVQAGLPDMADDHVENCINLHEYVVENPEKTFFVRAKGQSMKNVGIGDGDMMVVERSVKANDGNIVIASLDGELTVKRLHKTSTSLQLLPENEDFEPINVSQEQDLQILGVVTNVIHKL